MLARESYDSAVMGLRDWELVFVMSTDPVAQSMRVRYAGNNPQNPFVMYGRERAIRVKILSITPLGPPERQLPRRFGAHPAQPGQAPHRRLYLDNQLVTMRFEYNQNLALSEQDRILNPLAFQVTEYRVDNDYSRGVPVPDDGAMQAQAQQAAQAAQQAQGVYDPNNPAAATMIDPATGRPVAVPANGQVPGQAMPGQPVQGQPMPGQPVQGQAMPGQAMPDSRP